MTSPAVLVTGGAGYIGSHVAKALHDRGTDVVVLDDLSRGHSEFARWGTLVEGSTGDEALLANVFATYPIDSVIHFAAFADVGESVRDPESYYANNVGNTASLLRAMHAAGVRDIVFSSTCATYGEPVEVPIPESHPQSPVNPYGRTKLMVEQMLWDYAAAYGFHAVALRYFNAAGADPAAEIGEWHDPEAHLIPRVLDAAMGLSPCVGILGEDYPTPDGTCIRDYVHVCDLAEAHITALGHARAGHTGAFNLGTGSGTSVRDVIEAVERVTGLSVPTRTEPRRQGDPAVLVADATRAREVLGWTPRRPDIDTIVGDAWCWHRKLRAREG